MPTIATYYKAATKTTTTVSHITYFLTDNHKPQSPNSRNNGAVESRWQKVLEYMGTQCKEVLSYSIVCVYDPLTVRLTLAIDGPLVIRISTICACPAHAAKWSGLEPLSSALLHEAS